MIAYIVCGDSRQESMVCRGWEGTMQSMYRSRHSGQFLQIWTDICGKFIAKLTIRNFKAQDGMYMSVIVSWIGTYYVGLITHL